MSRMSTMTRSGSPSCAIRSGVSTSAMRARAAATIWAAVSFNAIGLPPFAARYLPPISDIDPFGGRVQHLGEQRPDRVSNGGGMTKDQPISLWDVTAAEPDHSAPLDGDVSVDLAIVGGGFTGLSTALHAAEAGLSAHVIEAHQIGHGGSGRNVGLVNAGVWHPPAAVREMLGPVFGPRFIERFGAAPDYVFSLIERHQIRCEVTKTGTIHAAHAASGLRDLQARHAEWTRLGAPVEMLSRQDMVARAGTQAFVGGLLDQRAGTINPMGYVRGLARAALGAGAAISTGVRATGSRRDGEGWIVETDRRTLRAKYVVLGTNAYTDDPWPHIKRVFTKIHYFQLATAPLGERVRDILPGR